MSYGLSTHCHGNSDPQRTLRRGCSPINRPFGDFHCDNIYVSKSQSGSDDKKAAIHETGHALIYDALGIQAPGVELDLEDGSNLAIMRSLGRIARFWYDVSEVMIIKHYVEDYQPNLG